MRKLVLVAPDWLGESYEDSALQKKGPGLQALLDRAELKFIAPLDGMRDVEVASLGLAPHKTSMEAGPLVVAALGADPPERSVQYRLNTLSFNDSQLYETAPMSFEEALAFWPVALRLSSGRQTVIQGSGSEHGYVLENGSPEMRTLSPEEVHGQCIEACWPQSEDEAILRRLIDDSINLLSDLDLNKRRLDKGDKPINCLWPWAGGFRMPVPNRLFELGPIHVESSSITLEGLARLAKWRHGDRGAFGRGTAVRIESWLAAMERHSATIVFLPSFSGFRAANQIEELHWLTAELDRRLFVPLAEAVVAERDALLIAAPNVQVQRPGLAAIVAGKAFTSPTAPFDERAIEDKVGAIGDLWSTIDSFLRWNPRA